MKFIRWGVLSGTFVLASVSTAATARNPLRFEELARVARVGAFDVSPDGRWIACTVGTPVVAENLTRSAIWIAAAAGAGEPRRLTAGNWRDSDPAFSPDGSRVAFL